MKARRHFLFLFILFSACLSHAANIIYTNFQLGHGYVHDGSYSAVGSGKFITVPLTVAQANGWKMNNLGDETVVAGQKDPNATPTKPEYDALIYMGHNFSVSQYAPFQPLANGVPYSGGLVTATSDHANFDLSAVADIYEGAYSAAFGGNTVNVSGVPFVAYNSSGTPVIYDVVNVDGQNYLTDGNGSSVPISDPTAIPVYYKNDNGDLTQGYYNADTKQFSVEPGGGSGSGSSGTTVDLSPVVNAVNTQGGSIVNSVNSNHASLRNFLVEKLGSTGNSWVYDCKLSLGQLVSLAGQNGLGVDLPSEVKQYIAQIYFTSGDILSSLYSLNEKDFSPTVNVAAPNVTVTPAAPNVTVTPQVSAPDVNVTVNPAEVNIDTSALAKESTLSKSYSMLQTISSCINTQGSNLYLELYGYIRPMVNDIKSILTSWNTGNEVPSSLPQPEFGDDEPNDNLPSFVQAAWSANGALSDSSLGQVYGDMVDWGDNGSPTMIVPDFISGFLSSFVGSIPSVGSDPDLFSFTIDLPFIGQIDKHWSWRDFPYVSDFRAFLVWLVYLFFGLACFKLLHKTMI